MRGKRESKIFLACLLWLFLFLPMSVFGQTTAAELVKKIDEQLETGKVLEVMKWNPQTQEMTIFDPLVDSEDSPQNFSLETGVSFFVLTDVRGVEFVDLPFEIVTPQIVDGWNLVSWESDLIEKYDIKQITCFNPEFQRYEDIIIGFNNEILPAEGEGCWLFVGQGRETEGTPHAIYGEVAIGKEKVQATVSIINLTSGEQGITESDKNGKFAYDLLNLGWKAGDKIVVSASASGSSKDVFLDINPKVPNQRIDISLAEMPKERPPALPAEWNWRLIIVVVAVVLICLIILLTFIFAFKKRQKK